MNTRNKKVILKRKKGTATQRIKPPRPAEKVRPARHGASADVAAAAGRQKQRVPNLEAEVLQLKARVREVTVELGREQKQRVPNLEAEVLQLKARVRELSVELGRELNELKEFIGHANFQRLIAKPLLQGGITPRIVKNYMRMAREADSKIDKPLRDAINGKDLN